MAIARRRTSTPHVQITFDLHGLEWTAPDRIEVSGAFAGMASPLSDPPVLVVRGAEGSRRLEAAPESVPAPPQEGQPWRAAFSWDTAPFPFETATLEFADGTSVDLAPLGVELESAAPAAAVEEVSASATDRLHLQAELLAAEAAARDAAAEAERFRTELARAKEDLEAERARNAADAERFREGLESVERAAQAALAEHQSAAEQLGTDLREAGEAIAVRDAELAVLRERIAEQEQAGEEAKRARAEAERAAAVAHEARGESERLASRLARIREILDAET
jgi:hypothetical protein